MKNNNVSFPAIDGKRYQCSKQLFQHMYPLGYAFHEKKKALIVKKPKPWEQSWLECKNNSMTERYPRERPFYFSPQVKEAMEKDSLFAKCMQTYRVTNVVCSAQLSCKQNPQEIAIHVAGSYSNKGFPSCMCKNLEPSATIHIFQSGKCNCIGTQCEENALLVIYKIAERLSLELHQKLIIYRFLVKNIVISVSLTYHVNLNRLHRMDELSWEYNPNRFPGVIYPIPGTKKVAQIFESGKINIAGAKTDEEAADDVLEIEKITRLCRIYSWTYEKGNINLSNLFQHFQSLLNDMEAATKQLKPTDYLCVGLNVKELPNKEKDKLRKQKLRSNQQKEQVKDEKIQELEKLKNKLYRMVGEEDSLEKTILKAERAFKHTDLVQTIRECQKMINNLVTSSVDPDDCLILVLQFEKHRGKIGINLNRVHQFPESVFTFEIRKDGFIQLLDAEHEEEASMLYSWLWRDILSVDMLSPHAPLAH